SLLTLWALKWVDDMLPRVHRSRLVIESGADTQVPDIGALLGEGFVTRFLEQKRGPDGERLTTFDVRWTQTQADATTPPPELIARVEERYTVRSFEIV